MEGAFVGNFDPDYYKSDRKDQKIDTLTVVARGDQVRLQAAVDEARVVGESQNFTRDLVNEPSNRHDARYCSPSARGRDRAESSALKCEVLRPRPSIEPTGVWAALLERGRRAAPNRPR